LTHRSSPPFSHCCPIFVVIAFSTWARSDRILKEVPTYRVITVSTLIDRMKVNGSLARRAIAFLEKEGHIRRVVHHNAQLVYTRATAGKE
jgi:ribosomal protein S25